MIYGSVCSGIEAATVAWHPLGWSPAFFAEIEKFPSQVLAHHYGSNMPGEPAAANGVPNYGDMTKFKEWPDHAIDILVGGTPCQSFSVAGLRKGLDDPRGNLMLTYLAIARRYRPRWVVWENVPGVLSSNKGRDFGTFLAGLGELGYGWAYRVIDAQFVRVDGYERAVPQRRRRVFVVGYLGDWRRAAAVLLEPESLRGDPAPSRKAGQKAAPTISARTQGGGGLGTDFELDGGLIVADVAGTLPAGGNANGGDRQPGMGQETADTMLVAHAYRTAGVGAIAIQAGALRENPESGPDGVGVQSDLSYTLEARAEVQAVAFDPNQITSKANRSIPRGDVLHTLPATSNPPHLATAWAVRRLMPVECERLQGFPDGYTDIMPKGKPTPDGPRYKALGNSMAVNCMRWLGRRIEMIEEISKEIEGSL